LVADGVVALEVLGQSPQALLAHLARTGRRASKAVLVKLESGRPLVVTMASWVNQEAPTVELGVRPKVPRAPKLFLPLTSFRLSPWPL
jgi:hypothetical protein